MRIKYVGRRGIGTIILGGVLGTDRIWNVDEDPREYAEGQMIQIRTSGGISETPAIAHILGAGPEWIDADTGKNPYFTCATCGDVTTSSGFTDLKSLKPVAYVDQNGKRLCIRDFLAANPQYLGQHKRSVYDQQIVRDAQDIIDKRAYAEAVATSGAPAVAVATAPPPTKPAAADEEKG